jgi:SagB-type dehydrogenase family enzyme
MQMKKSTTKQVYFYHDRSKHHLQRYAHGPAGLDWQNQPDPFRTYTGCDIVQLPLLTKQTSVTYADLYYPDKLKAQPVSLMSIAQLLELSLGLSAWKQYGDNRWALRCNPSSGNLHPTEAYILCNRTDALAAGVYHYVSRDHTLEHRCQSELALPLPDNSILLGLSSIFWREAWKYGERAFRYCQHDVGHAIAAIRYAVATLGWKAQALTELADDETAAILGINRDADFQDAEWEHPDIILLISADQPKPLDDKKLLEVIASGRWFGKANRLSEQHTDDWAIIEQTATAAHKPQTPALQEYQVAFPEPGYPAANPLSASSIIKQRRSAQNFHPDSAMTLNDFYRLLDLALPRASMPPWDVFKSKPRIHLLIFVHNIEGLTPGLYLLTRSKTSLPLLREKIQGDFDWRKPESCPAHLDLYCLTTGNARPAARTLSCHQDIASDSAVSFAMLADFDSEMKQAPWYYRQLFWESGLLGQLFYLEAEACGLRGTGIGCYFDDAVHELLGLKDHTFQDLYHFTIGLPLDDTRLQTIPPYAHLDTSTIDE